RAPPDVCPHYEGVRESGSLALSRSPLLVLGAIVGIWCGSGCATTPMPVDAPPPAEQAPVITLREVDQDQGIHEVTRRTGIVDINSLLTIRVDSTALRQHVAGLVGPT